MKILKQIFSFTSAFQMKIVKQIFPFRSTFQTIFSFKSTSLSRAVCLKWVKPSCCCCILCRNNLLPFQQAPYNLEEANFTDNIYSKTIQPHRFAGNENIQVVFRLTLGSFSPMLSPCIYVWIQHKYIYIYIYPLDPKLVITISADAPNGTRSWADRTVPIELNWFALM